MNRAASAVLATLNSIWGGLTNGAQSLAQQMSLVPAFLGHTLWLLSLEFRELARRGYGANAAVYATLRVVSSAVAEPPLVAYTRDPDGTPGDPLPWAHPLRKLIRSPNPYLTEYEFHELSTLHLAVTGRFTAWKERNPLGEPIALWPLRPDRVGPIYGKAAEGEPLLLGWSYQVPGSTHYIALPANDVILVNFPHLDGESGGLVEGFGPLQALASEVSADVAATNHIGALLANHAMPATILQVKGAVTSPEDAYAIKEAFRLQHGGNRRGGVAIVDNETTVTSVGFNLQQLEFKGLRNVSESRITAAVGVPAILVGLLVGLDASSTNATVDELRAFFAETTCANYWRRYGDTYTEQLASEFGDAIVCQFDLTKVRALISQEMARIDRIRDAYSNGALTKNEYREALDFEPRDDGDVYVYGIAPGRGTEVATPPAAPDQDTATGIDPTEPKADAGTGATPATPAAPAQGASKSALTAHLQSALSGIHLYQGQQGVETAFAELMAAIERDAVGV